MGVDAQLDVGRQGGHLYGQHAFRDELARARPHDADAQYVLRFRVEDELGRAIVPP
jgi:hypothetical protein